MQRDLVVRARQGDEEAFSILADRAIDHLHAVAYGTLRDQDRADDATQRASPLLSKRHFTHSRAGPADLLPSR